jgi:hypothetical protein
VIPVAKAQSKIQVGDLIVCYGKLENLKELVLKQGKDHRRELEESANE